MEITEGGFTGRLEMIPIGLVNYYLRYLIVQFQLNYEVQRLDAQRGSGQISIDEYFTKRNILRLMEQENKAEFLEEMPEFEWDVDCPPPPAPTPEHRKRCLRRGGEKMGKEVGAVERPHPPAPSPNWRGGEKMGGWAKWRGGKRG